MSQKMFYATAKVVAKTQAGSDGLHLICLRVTYARKSRYYSLNLRTPLNEWSADAGRFARSRANYKKDNEFLATKEARALDTIRAMERDGLPFSFDGFEFDFCGSINTTLSVVDAIREIQISLEDNDTPANADMYKRLGNLVTEYKARATMSDLTPGWVAGFFDYLNKSGRMNKGGLSLIARTFKAACTRWIKAGILRQKPFEGFTLPNAKIPGAGQGIKTGLRKEQIRALEQTEYTNKHERFAVDVFLLSFYLWGMNLADMAELRRDNIKDGRVHYIRKKTKRQYSVLLSEKAKAIIGRYDTKGGGYLLPIYKKPNLTERQKRTRKKNFSDKLRPYLRVAGLRAGIPDEQMFLYNARHSFATICKDEGTNIMQIMELMGHSDIRITSGYLQDFKKEVLDAAALAALE